MLDGMVIWGDVAYQKDLFFSPDYWWKHFKPVVKLVHEYGRYSLQLGEYDLPDIKYVLDSSRP